MEVRAIRGFNDILPGDTLLWRHIEAEAFRVFASYGFREIKLPIVEKTELFARSIGETTDIVEKEMYSFPDRRDESLTLRPEGTAPAVRAYVEHKLYTSPITKLYYTGPMFRYERPQKGRYRQFYQIGAEVLGDGSPAVDAEALEMLVNYFNSIGLKDAALNINSLGCSSCRPPYKMELLRFLTSRMDDLCENCSRRVEENPLRALDCKSEHCKAATTDAPSILDHLCQECMEHFASVKHFLALHKVSYHLNPRMVRGLDYYSRTTFEITARGLGAQDTVAAGGRYDGLVGELGGPETPCFGFAIGIERLAIAAAHSNALGKRLSTPLVYFISLGADTFQKGIETVRALREAGLRVEADYRSGPLKAAMKRADKLGACQTAILGEDELAAEEVSLKDMSSAAQERVPLKGLSGLLTERLSPSD